MSALQKRRSPAATGLQHRTHNTFSRVHCTPANVNVLLARLDGVRPAGKGWRARCPVHGGKSPSLSIAESGGYVLIRCHAACTAQAVAEAVGLTLADLCPQRDGSRRPGSFDAASSAAMAEASRRRREAEEHARHVEAAERALALWNAVGEANPDHPYLRAKGIAPHGLREAGGCLLIPMRDTHGVLWNVQRINASGTKKFMPGARIRGLFHLIGCEPVGVLCVAEGYATAASVFQATGYPAACALNAGNLEPVAVALRASYPGARMVITADNDAATAARIGRNPGVEAATAAARAVGGLVAVPRFGTEAKV